MRMRRFVVGLLAVVGMVNASCSVVNTETVDVERYVERTPTQIEVSTQCGGTYPSVEETASAVTVTIKVNKLAKNDCAGWTTIDLDSPLGDRTVIDAFDDEPMTEGQP